MRQILLICFIASLESFLSSFTDTFATAQSALEARSKIGLKPTRKYVRRKGVQPGSEQGAQAAEGAQEDQHMTGLDSAHSGSPGLEGLSSGV